MQFFTTFFTLSPLVLPTFACKCFDPERPWIKDAPLTEFCCKHLMDARSWMTRGPGIIDCAAWSISEVLANFDECCGSGKIKYFSDCPCKHGCRTHGPPAAVEGAQVEDGIEYTTEIRMPVEPTATVVDVIEYTTEILLPAEPTALVVDERRR